MFTSTVTSLAFAVTLLASPGTTDEGLFPGPLERGPDGVGHQHVPDSLVPGRALLRIDPKADLDDVARRADLHIVKVRDVVLGWTLVELRDAAADAMPTEDETRALIARLTNQKGELVDGLHGASPEHWWRPQLVPNDTFLGDMWHLDMIDAFEAWDITVGTAGQRVGVLDTGLIRAHEDVGLRAVRGFDFISSTQASNDGNGRDSNFEDAGDDCGQGNTFHGTHVAGTIGAAANNSRGIAGLNWNAGLVIARVLGRCGGTSTDILEGAAWMAGAQIPGVTSIGTDRVSVMNLSLGGANACSTFEQQVVDFVDGQGAVFVAAAGNNGGGPVGAPANCARAIGVGAFGPSGTLASYSAVGQGIDIVGPGGDVDGGVLSSFGPFTNSYAFNMGTSMASPHVAGAVSLLQAAVPGVTRAQVLTALQSSGLTCGGCGGRAALNIPASLAALGVTGPPAGDVDEPEPEPDPAQPPPAAPPADDIFEQNDSIGTATQAACNVDDDRLIAAPADQDFFTFTPTRGQSLTIRISAANGADLDLYVLNTSGNVLGRSESTTGNERITGNASGNRLIVMVNPFVNAQTGVQNSGPYRITILCSGGTAAFDPGAEAGPPEEDTFAPIISSEGTIVGDELVPATTPIEIGPASDLPEVRVQSDAEIAFGCSNAGAPVLPMCAVLVLVALRRRQRRSGASGAASG